MLKYIWILFISSICFSQSSIDKAEMYISSKKFVSAQSEMQNYLATNPDHVKANELLGDAYGHQRKWDKAIEQYKTLKIPIMRIIIINMVEPLV